MSKKLMQWRNAPGFGEKHLYVCDRDCPQLQNRASHNASDLKGTAEFFKLYFEDGYTLLPDPVMERRKTITALDCQGQPYVAFAEMPDATGNPVWMERNRP